jgi:hypothetical protein
MLETSPNVKSRYLMLWPGAGNPAKEYGADIILVQSFGRNTYPDVRLGIMIHYCLGAVNGDNERMFALIKKFDFDPGDMNSSLAKELVNLMENFSIQNAVVQWEIGFALWNNHPEFFGKMKREIEIVWPDRNQKYMSPVSVIDRTISIAKIKGFEKIACLSHRRMETRVALMVAERTDIDLVCVKSHTVSFSNKSVQWWTRGPIRWLARESFVRVFFMIKSWV